MASPDKPEQSVQPIKSEAEITNDLLQQLLAQNERLLLALGAVNGNLKTGRRSR